MVLQQCCIRWRSGSWPLPRWAVKPHLQLVMRLWAVMGRVFSVADLCRLRQDASRTKGGGSKFLSSGVGWGGFGLQFLIKLVFFLIMYGWWQTGIKCNLQPWAMVFDSNIMFRFEILKLKKWNLLFLECFFFFLQKNKQSHLSVFQKATLSLAEEKTYSSLEPSSSASSTIEEAFSARNITAPLVMVT